MNEGAKLRTFPKGACIQFHRGKRVLTGEVVNVMRCGYDVEVEGEGTYTVMSHEAFRPCALYVYSMRDIFSSI